MLRSLMTAVTGVKAHQVMLDATGNNIANVNTTGYKKDFVIFQDLLYQTTQGASGPSGARGGVNPAQVGLGVKVGAIETIHSDGPTQYTGNKSDMLIDGQGYFVFRNGGTQIYSRAGNFTLDPANNLVHSGTGYYVQGYEMVRDPLNPLDFTTDGSISDIEIPMNKKLEARATTLVGFHCNLGSDVDPYLPVGYLDISSTTDSQEPKVRINDVMYDMDIETDLSKTDGDDYLAIKIAYPGAADGATSTVSITFDMDDISDDGYPMLTLDAASSAPAAPNAPASVLGYGYLPDGLTQYRVEYTDLDGMLKLVGTSGETLWSTNLHQKMNYSSFTVSRGSNDYRFLAEFKEIESPDGLGTEEPGYMSGSPMQMTLWWATTAGGPMAQTVYNVYMNQDGTFDKVNYVSTTQSALPGSMSTMTWAVYDEAGKITTGDFGLEVSEDGKSLEFKAAAAAGAALSTVGTVNQGGNWPTKGDIYDCQGNKYTLEVSFKKISNNRWRWEAYIPGNDAVFVTPNSGELIFDDSCLLVEPKNPPSITIDFGMEGTSFQTVKLDFSGQSFGLDPIDGITQFAGENTTKQYVQDGYTWGTLNNWNVQRDGQIIGTYTNGQSLPIYQIALAQFANPMGLEKTGDTMFAETVNSGRANINPAEGEGGGSIVASSLEMSNVDLTEEFTRLIIAQRGFQANTRVVTTSDQILEEVVNLKR